MTTGIVINDGEIQRSMLQSVELAFDSDISPSLQDTDVRILDRDSGLLIDTTQVQLTWSSPAKTLTLTFPGLTGGSLPDGNYRVIIESGALSASGVDLDGDGDGVPGGVYQFDFHRFFGDSSGNRTVDTLDGYNFRNTYNSTLGSPAYRAAFDFNSDGVINLTDRAAFEANFRQTLSPPVEGSGEGLEGPVADEGSTRDLSKFPTSSKARHPYRSMVLPGLPEEGETNTPQPQSNSIYTRVSFSLSQRSAAFRVNPVSSSISTFDLKSGDAADEEDQLISLYQQSSNAGGIFDYFTGNGGLYLR